jgi:F0F1-type ATP synthase membrane subunit b/b'
MENTKEQLEKEVTQRHMETLDKKADVMGAEVKETVSDAKLGAVNLADKASEMKENASHNWENVKDKAGDMYDDAKDKAEEIGEKIGDKYDELKAKAKAALS